MLIVIAYEHGPTRMLNMIEIGNLPLRGDTVVEMVVFVRLLPAASWTSSVTESNHSAGAVASHSAPSAEYALVCALCVAAQTPMEMSLCAPRFEVAALAEFALPRPLFRRPRREAQAAGLDGSQPHASRRLVARSPPVHRGDGRHRGAVRLARCRAHRRRASRPRPARTPLRVAASLTWIAPNAVRDWWDR
jgi:hypothetical protein